MSKLTPLIRRQQLTSLLKRAGRYRQAGEPVPFDLQLCIALAQNRIPDSPVDERQRLDSRMVKVSRGKHIKLARTPAGTGHDPDDVRKFIGTVPKVRHLAGWNSPGARASTPPSARRSSERLQRRMAERTWLDLGERPATVSVADWALLRLAVRQRMDASAIAARLTAMGDRVTPTAIRKRLQRVRAKLANAKGN
jgi:hypothetical protein